MKIIFKMKRTLEKSLTNEVSKKFKDGYLIKDNKYDLVCLFYI